MNLTAAHNDKVHTKVTEILTRGEISQKTADYLVLQCPRIAKFYLLPKIHKNKTPPPGRPIVSANDCPTERISEFVDHFINPMVPKLPSYLRGSGHFLQILKYTKPTPGSILATLDATSLYTNIPKEEGIQAVLTSLAKERDPLDNPTNRSLGELLRLVLTCNNFEFDNTHFLQVETKLAPSYANIFMGEFERLHVYLYHLQPSLWKRFIDDICFIWPHGTEELKRFVEFLNN